MYLASPGAHHAMNMHMACCLLELRKGLLVRRYLAVTARWTVQRATLCGLASKTCGLYLPCHTCEVSCWHCFPRARCNRTWLQWQAWLSGPLHAQLRASTKDTCKILCTGLSCNVETIAVPSGTEDLLWCH